MKFFFSLFVCVLSLSITSHVHAQDPAHFGKHIDAKGAITMAELDQQMKGKERMQVKVTGTVVECCQAKGCWMTIDKGDGATMRVKFKDYGFFVPKNSAGKTAIMEGIAMIETTPVDELQHYASDAGKSKEEIEAITQPERELVFEAEGVILK